MISIEQDEKWFWISLFVDIHVGSIHALILYRAFVLLSHSVSVKFFLFLFSLPLVSLKV